MPSCGVRLSVCLSVTFGYFVKTNNIFLYFFHLRVSHVIRVFPYQTLWQYSDGNPHNEGVECRWGRQKSRFTTDIWLHRVMSTLRPPSHTAAPDRGKLVTLIDGKRRRLLFARDSRRSVYDKKHQRYAEDN